MSSITKRIENFSNLGLGLQRDSLKLVDHHERWKRLYSDEATHLYHNLRIENLRLYHCGSTAIPGIKTKPILDIVGSVENITTLDNKKETFENLGYEPKGEYGIEGRRYYVLYNPEKNIGYCHLHLYEHNHNEIINHLAFRDLLINDSNLAKQYELEKITLLNDQSVTRQNYSKSKEKVITSLLNNKNIASGNALILNASADGGSNTINYANQLYNKAKVIKLSDLNIKGYRYITKPEPSSDFIHLINKILSSNQVILATPVYWYSMSSELKMFIDNLSYLLDGEYKELGEKLRFKKINLVSTGNDLFLPTGFEVPFIQTAIYFGMDYMGAMYKSIV